MNLSEILINLPQFIFWEAEEGCFRRPRVIITPNSGTLCAVAALPFAAPTRRTFSCRHCCQSKHSTLPAEGRCSCAGDTMRVQLTFFLYTFFALTLLGMGSIGLGANMSLVKPVNPFDAHVIRSSVHSNPVLLTHSSNTSDKASLYSLPEPLCFYLLAEVFNERDGSFHQNF